MMSDWRCKTPRPLQHLEYTGYAVWYEANCRYRAEAPDGRVLYYGDDEHDAWTACNTHAIRQQNAEGE